MRSVLYLGDNDLAKKLFAKFILQAGYEPVICKKEGSLLYNLAFDKALRKKDCKEITAEFLFEEFKNMMGKVSPSLSAAMQDSSSFQACFEKQSKYSIKNPICAVVLDEMIGTYTNETIEVLKDIKDSSVSVRNCLLKSNSIKQQQIRDFEGNLSRVQFIRRAGYSGPLFIHNEFEKLGNYDVQGSFLNAGADYVTGDINLFRDFDSHLNFVEKIKLADITPIGMC